MDLTTNTKWVIGKLRIHGEVDGEIKATLESKEMKTAKLKENVEFINSHLSQLCDDLSCKLWTFINS